MTVTGTIQDGVVVLDSVRRFPDGTKVDVTIVEIPTPAEPAPEPSANGTHAPAGKGTMAWMLKYAGVLDDMPADFAEQHDHYIHGTPKR